MKNEIEQVKKYMQAAIEGMEIYHDGILQKDLSKMPSELSEKLLPLVIEFAKMIQIEANKDSIK